MNVIIKIDEYLSDTQQIVMRICRLHSLKKIDEYMKYAIDIVDLDLSDTDTFVDSLILKTKHLIQNQEESEPILDENLPIKVDSELDIYNLIDKVIEGKVYDKGIRLLKMRRVKL